MFMPLMQLSRRLEATVTVLHVLRRSGGDPARWLEEGRQATQRLTEQLASGGITCDFQLMESVDDIAGAILDAGRETQATLILMGITGKSPFARVTSGDVPSELLRRTTIPVLLLPPAVDLNL